MPNILPENLVIHRSVPIHGITQLGLPLGHLHLRSLQQHLHSLGMTNPFSPRRHSDPLVLATLLGQWQDLSFLTSGIPIRPFQGEFMIFMDASSKAGAPTWGFSDSGCMDPFGTQAPHQCAGAQGSNIGPPSLGYSITGPSWFDRYRQYLCCSLHQQTGWDPFSPRVEKNCFCGYRLGT